MRLVKVRLFELLFEIVFSHHLHLHLAHKAENVFCVNRFYPKTQLSALASLGHFCGHCAFKWWAPVDPGCDAVDVPLTADDGRLRGHPLSA